MSLSLEKTINQKLFNIFNTLGYDSKFAVVKTSDRPDLSDFQCNGALALAKSEHKNPREIATSIANELQKDSDFENISVDGPGFINIKINNSLIGKIIDSTSKNKRLGCEKVTEPKTIVLDFGGPNVAKALHVGHLRSAVIGESIRRIEEFVGNKTISDVHFGDWGTPMGMIIAEIIHKDGDLSKVETYNVDEISAIYKQANIRCKEDEEAKETARQITAKMQDGHPEYRKAWQYLRDVSVAAVKKNYDELDDETIKWLQQVNQNYILIYMDKKKILQKPKVKTETIVAGKKSSSKSKAGGGGGGGSDGKKDKAKPSSSSSELSYKPDVKPLDLPYIDRYSAPRFPRDKRGPHRPHHRKPESENDIFDDIFDDIGSTLKDALDKLTKGKLGDSLPNLQNLSKEVKELSSKITENDIQEGIDSNALKEISTPNNDYDFYINDIYQNTKNYNNEREL